MATGTLPRAIEPQPTVTTDTDWWTDAHCNTGTSELTGLFFSDELPDIAAAKRICAACPVLEVCLAGALERREQIGVWGGQLFRNGRILTTKRGRGRPAVTPRPEDVMPQVAIPEGLADQVRYVPRSVA